MVGIIEQIDEEEKVLHVCCMMLGLDLDRV